MIDMKKGILSQLFYGALLLGVVSCSSKNKIGSYYTTEPFCLGTELDGSQTLRSWGNGRNITDGVEQAKKNAVYAVVFKGIHSGNGECEKKPLLMEVNAAEKYQYYFNEFFKDGGAYVQYVSSEDTRPGSRQKVRNDMQRKYETTVRVLRAELRERLIRDNILKP